MITQDQLTHKVQESLAKATELVADSGHTTLEPLHVLRVFLDDSSNIVIPLFERMGVNIQSAREVVDARLFHLSQGTTSQIQPSPDFQKWFDEANRLRKKSKAEFLSTEHLLLTVRDSSSLVRDVFDELSIDQARLEQSLVDIRPSGQSSDSPTGESNYNVLEKYTTNLTKLAKEQKLGPVIGRDQEIRRIVEILSRKTKNNPILIGEPGTGKTAIAEGLAQRIVNGDVPSNLHDRQLLQLDLASLVAGAKFRGEFEERLKGVIQEVKSSNGTVILFIDEIHTIVGTGAGEGKMDVANILKPVLSRGEIKVIGATTLNEYQKHIEKDTALERRFQVIYVDQPSEEEAISILRGIKESYETHHGVRITDAAVVAAVKLSTRYIPERFLPDKAIDLLDEATAALKVEASSMPKELDNAKRSLQQLQIEREALKGEKGKESKEQLRSVQEKIASLEETVQALEFRWNNEKKHLEEGREMKRQIEQFQKEAELQEREGNLQEVARLRYGVIPELEKKLVQHEQSESTSSEHLLKQEVGEEDILQVVARWTGIPVVKLAAGEQEKLAHMEEVLSKRVIGQDKAISAVSNAIRRSRAGISEPHRPVGSFLFLGSTGVGKTELAKALAEFLFNDDQAIVRLDMSEYAEQHAVAKLIGSPPGYVGYDEGGQLTEAVRKRPYSIILLDEVEKAHPEVFNILLQILDDGRLTDSKGRTANFSNTVIIMTSNLGSQYLQQERSFQDASDRVFAEVRQFFRPELLNRIDEQIVFHQLDDQHLLQILELQIQSVLKRLHEQDITITLDEKAKKFLLTHGVDQQFGARPLKRAVQQYILNPIALGIVDGTYGPGSVLNVSTSKGGQLTFVKV